MSGEATTLPPGVDLCAYRIVQEALSNARRHAPGATVDVEIAYSPDSLALRIKDDGPGSADGDLDGHGLLGMRERATIAGGTLRAGPSEPGGRRRGGAAGAVMTIRVVVADDQEIVGQEFAALLETQNDITVVGTAANGVEAVRACREEHPDVVLMDIRMPTLDGIEATRQLGEDGDAR